MYFGFWAPPRFSNAAYVLKLKSASVIIFFFHKLSTKKHLNMFWAMLCFRSSKAAAFFKMCWGMISFWSVQLPAAGLVWKKSPKEQEERKQEEDSFREKRPSPTSLKSLKNVFSPREVELVNEVQGRCLVPTMCWIYQRLFWPVYQGRWWTPQYSRSSLRSIDQLSLVSALPTSVSQSLCSPLCSVMFFTNGCAARICAILSVKSETVGLRKQCICGVSNAHAFIIFNCNIPHSQKPSQ